jgi:hypothetical protein
MFAFRRFWLLKIAAILLLILVVLIVSARSERFNWVKAIEERLAAKYTAEGQAIVDARKNDLPTPPPGFSGAWCNTLHAYFLKPDNWVMKEATNTPQINRYQCSITREDPEVVPFSPGLYVEATRNYQKTNHAAPSVVAKQYIDQVAANAYDKYPDLQSGRTKSFVIYTIHTKEMIDGQSYIIFNRAVGNDEADTFYVLKVLLPEELFLQDESQGFKLMTPLATGFQLDSQF